MANDLIQIGIDVRTNIKQATADLDKMGGSVVNNINTINRLESEIDQLNRELGRGRVTEAAYAKGMRQINNELTVFQQRAEKAAEVERKFGQTAATGGKSLNRFNMVLQQGGYQLQDFVVQLQSGTNFFTAFSQQGSQFASIFGPKGAVVGAVIALGSAVGGTLVASFLGAKKEVESFEDQLDNLTDTLEEYRSLSERIADSKALSEEFGNLSGQAKSILETLKLIQGITLKKQLSELGGVGRVVRETVTEATGAVSIPTPFGDIDVFPTFENIERLTQDQIETAKEFLGVTEGVFGETASYAGQYLRLLEQIQTAETFDQQVSAAAELDKFLKAHVEARGAETKNLEQITALQNVLLQLTKNQASEQSAAAKELELEEQKKRDRATATAAMNSYFIQQRLEREKQAAEEIESNRVALLQNTQANATRANAERLEAEREEAIKLEQERQAIQKATLIAATKANAQRYETERAEIAKVENTRNQLMISSLQNATRANADRIKQEQDAAERQKKIDNDRLLVLSALNAKALENLAALDDSATQAERLTAALEDAAAAMSAISGFNLSLQDRLAKITAENEAIKQGLNGQIAGEIKLLKIKRDRLVLSDALGKQDRDQMAAEITQIDNLITAYEEQLNINDKLTTRTTTQTKAVKDNRTAYEKAMMTATEFADALDRQVISAVGNVANAFSDFLVGGLKDFKSFVGSIKDMFIRLLADMAAQALASRILIPIAAGTMAGVGASAAAGATTGNLIAGGGIGGTLALGASSLGMGASAALGIGGYASAGLFNVGANAAVATAAGASPMMATIGAAIPPLIAVAAVIGLLTKKTKVLDTGLRATVEGFDAAIESFQVTQTSRLFGLLKGKKVTSYGAAPSAIAAPIVEAIGGIQQSVLDAAQSLGIGTGLFEDFSYKFQLSLQGLTEEQKMQKLNEELSKMGDAFASLSGHFETMNELLQVAQQRYDLETRLLTLLNDQSALLTRQRQIERAATHELNQGTLDQIYALEDAYRGVNTAFATAQRSIEARKKAITNSFNEVMESIQSRVQAASQAVSLSQSILSSLQSAAGRGIGMSREAGLSYLRSLTGQARITDQEALSEALSAVGEPTEDLFSSFVDYQREFADQSNLIRDLEEKAGRQLSADEKLLKQLQEQERATEGRHNAQLSALDAQLSKAQAQIDALNNVDTSVKSVSEAMSDLAEAIKSAQAAQETAKASSAAATGGGSKAVAQFGGDLDLLSKYDMGSNYTRTSDNMTFDRIKLTGASQLLDAASMVGVSTTGKTGAQISQDIANAGYVAVNLDSATKAQQFALGGYHSGGLRMVGERGPELEATGPSRVYSANQTRRMMQNPDLVEAVKAMKEEIVELRNEQRQLGINNNKYTKRTYDLYRQWDTEGLPAERT